MSTRTATGCAHHRPTSLDEALRIAREVPGARFIAGGTDVLVHVRSGRVPVPPALVSLRRVPGLRGVTIGDTIKIGALTTVGELAAHTELARLVPALVMAARAFAGPQIQNAATIGGNLCNASPCADLVPPLLVHDARVVTRGSGGRNVIELDEFFIAPGETLLDDGEIVTEIVLPLPAAGTCSTFGRKVRVAMDLAIVNVAVAMRMDGSTCRAARVAAGAVAPTPLRLPDVEEYLTDRVLDDETHRRAGALAAAGVAPISDVRAGASYRRHMTSVMVRRALAELAAGGRHGSA